MKYSQLAIDSARIGQSGVLAACRSERIAKYNRLLEIEAELGKAAVFGR